MGEAGNETEKPAPSGANVTQGACSICCAGVLLKRAIRTSRDKLNLRMLLPPIFGQSQGDLFLFAHDAITEVGSGNGWIRTGTYVQATGRNQGVDIELEFV